jgi:hypothetical protein
MAKRRRSSSSGFRLNAPTQILFFVSLAVAVFALVARFAFIPNVSPHAFWIGIIAYIVLALGCVMKGL